MARSRKLWIEGPAGQLEAVLRLASPTRATALLAPPHPLHGGTLDNPVVFHADRELNRAGFTTLRFNFRGTGSSEGEHDDGRGEVEDLAHAASWLRGAAADVPLLLVGYSFGAWCALRHAVRAPEVAAVIAIGLPLRLYPIDEVHELNRPLAVVQGSDDEFGSPDEIRSRAGHADLRVVEGATHRFQGRATDVAIAVVEAGESLLSGLRLD
jgi:alpha/beta superfamily hydrolase